MQVRNLFKAYYIIIPLLIIGISLGFTLFPITLIILLPLLLFTERHAVGFFLLMYGGPLGGVIRAMYPSIPVYGLLLQFIGILLIWDLFVDLFRKNFNAIVGMLVVLLVFGFFYALGPKDGFSQNKFSTMCVHGIVMVLGYYSFNRSTRINVENLSLIMLVAALCMFAFCINKYSFTPGGITDYNWFRSQCMQHIGRWATGEPMLIGYQHIGMLVLFGTAIYLSQVKLSPSKAAFFVLCAFQMTMITGCRQAIFGLFIVVALRLVLFNQASLGKKRVLKRLIWAFLGLVVVTVGLLFLLGHSSVDVVSETMSEGDDGRQLLYIEALTIFQSNILTGAGIGGFNAITDDQWPHNFFLELLSETGLLGTSLLLIIVVFALSKRRAGLFHITASGQFYFLFLMALFIRVLVSSDLTESIELFSAVFAISGSKNNGNCDNQYNLECGE